jgi:hypothetical protein
VRTDKFKLDTPENLVKADATTDSITIAWDPVPEATNGYEVWYKEHGTEDWIRWQGNPDETSATIDGLDAGTAYDFRVCALGTDTHEQSGWAVLENVCTDTDTVPEDQNVSAPTDFNAETGTDVGEVDLTWTAADDPNVDGYVIRYKKRDATDWEESIIITGQEITSKTIGNLEPGEEYLFEIVATTTTDGFINSEPLTDTATAKAEPEPEPEPLDQPTDLDYRYSNANSAVKGNSVDLQWSGIAGVEYELQFSSDGGKTWTRWLGTSPVFVGKLATITVHTLSTGTYEFRVRATDGNAVSEWSNPLKNVKITADAGAEGTMRPGVAVVDSATTVSSITLNLTDETASGNTKIDFYRITCTDKSGNVVDMCIVAAGTGGRATATFAGLNPNTKYTFTVVALNINGKEGLNTATVSATTQKFVANKLKAVKKGEDKPTLSSVSFSLAPNAKVNTEGSEVVYEIALYAGKVKKASLPVGIVKIAADGTVLDNGGFLLAGNVDISKPIMINGLAASTKYTLYVKSIASGYAEHEVASLVSKITISTLKYKTVSGLKVAYASTGFLTLQWKVNTKSKRYDAADTYEVYYIDSQGNEQILSAVAGMEPQVDGRVVTGTFERGAVASGTVLYVRAIKVIGVGHSVDTELPALTSAMEETEAVVVKSQTAKVKVR